MNIHIPGSDGFLSGMHHPLFAVLLIDLINALTSIQADFSNCVCRVCDTRRRFYDNFCSVEFLFIPDIPGEDAEISPGWYSPRPKPHPLPLSVFVTLLYTTSSVPVGERSVIPARFRIFLKL